MPSQADDKRQAAREVIDILHEISILLVRVLAPLSASLLPRPIYEMDGVQRQPY